MSRLPVELCILVIAFAAVERSAGPGHEEYTADCMETLEACSLVCRAWYHHTIPHIWSSITVAILSPLSEKEYEGSDVTARQGWCMQRRGVRMLLVDVLAIFQSNRRLMASVRHFHLSFPSTVGRCQLSTLPELVTFCKTLAPLPRFSWRVDELEDHTIFTPSYDIADDNNHPLGQMITPFCNSPFLTTFAFSGSVFPFDVLKSMPNLKDVSFASVFRCKAPSQSVDDQQSSPTSFSFRLRRARFYGAESVYKHLIGKEGVFSQLEELTVSGEVYGDETDNSNLATLLSLPKGTLKTIDIDINKTSAFARGFIKHGLSLDFFKNMESCSIQISDFDRLSKTPLHASILNILEEAQATPLLFDKLKFFRLHLAFVDVSLFGEVFDARHRAWCIAKHLLGPSVVPSLETLWITADWYRAGVIKDLKDRQSIAARCVQMIESCTPVWEDDFRSVKRVFTEVLPS